MTRHIICSKLKQSLPALSYQPYPGDLGLRIQNEISAEAWAMWQKHQTMLINEYRLSMIDPEARKMLEQEMTSFLFDDKETTAPPGYNPEQGS